MRVQVSLSFEGNAQQALEFYQEVFRFPAPQIVRYGDAVETEDMPEETKPYILYTYFTIAGTAFMISDTFSGMGYAYGTSVGVALVGEETEEIKRLYNALKEGGCVDIELQETSWSSLYGMATDKFGVQWQFNLEPTA